MPHRKLRRNTPQRRLVLEELRGVTSHPTAVELYEIVRCRMPTISLGTVYRNLDLLAGEGVIRKHAFGGAEARFDGNTEPHHHVRCVKCGRMDDVGGLPVELAGIEPGETNGYKILGHRLEFVGICPACKLGGATSGTRATAIKENKDR